MARMAFILPVVRWGEFSASLGLGGGGGRSCSLEGTRRRTHHLCGVQRAKHRSATLNQHDPGKRGLSCPDLFEKALVPVWDGYVGAGDW